MPKVDLFSSQSGSGESTACVVAYDEDNPGIARIVSIVGWSDSWNAADVTIQISHDFESSPSNWNPIQILNGDTLTDLTMEANFQLSIQLPPGVAFRLLNTDEGSPVTVLNASAVGPIVAI